LQSIISTATPIVKITKEREIWKQIWINNEPMNQRLIPEKQKTVSSYSRVSSK
jgi:hypothetical protein